MKTHPAPGRRLQRGFSLVELMVAMGIGMVLVLLISTVMVRQESSRRTLTSGNDATLSGSFLSFMLDRELRSAGSGFAARGAPALGCRLNVQRGAVPVLPATAALPAPFTAVPVNVPLAAVMVYPDPTNASGPDVIGIQQGSSGLGEIPYNVRPNSVTALDLRLNNTVSFRPNDLTLISEQNRGCIVQQVSAAQAPGGDTLTFGGTYAVSAMPAVNLVDYGRLGAAEIINLGTAPRFQLFGLGSNDRLFTYDLLRLTDSADPQLMGEGVLMMRAVYGVDTNGDRTVDAWVSPRDAGWRPADLSAGTPAANAALRNILAVRVGLVLRGDLMEGTDVSPGTVALFTDLPTLPAETRTVTLDANQKRMRVRAVEFTVPLRNLLF